MCPPADLWSIFLRQLSVKLLAPPAAAISFVALTGTYKWVSAAVGNQKLIPDSMILIALTID